MRLWGSLAAATLAACAPSNLNARRVVVAHELDPHWIVGEFGAVLDANHRPSAAPCDRPCDPVRAPDERLVACNVAQASHSMTKRFQIDELAPWMLVCTFGRK
jgi:hypothetical protein